MKKYLVLIFFAFITTTVFAQHNYQDVVYLKNGSIIRGMIIEQIPDKSIKIETADRSVFVYKMDEIAKITKEPGKRMNQNPNNSSDIGTGYKSIAELGYQIGIGYWGMDRLKLNLIEAYQINPYFSAGLGTGVRYYVDADEWLIPVFADFRATFLNKPISPYFSLGIGYSFDASDRFRGAGFLLNPAAGVRFRLSDKSALNVGIGYEMQKIDTYSYYYNNMGGYTLYRNKENSGAIGITVGFSF